jgi:hypothetical protein
MAKAKIVLFGLVAALVLLAVGWAWGASGRWDAQASAQDAELRLRLAEGQASLALARVDLFELNYGQASRRLGQALRSMSDAANRLDANGQKDTADLVRDAFAKATQAQQLASSVNTAANQRAAEALQSLDRAVGLPRSK